MLAALRIVADVLFTIVVADPMATISYRGVRDRQPNPPCLVKDERYYVLHLPSYFGVVSTNSILYRVVAARVRGSSQLLRHSI